MVLLTLALFACVFGTPIVPPIYVRENLDFSGAKFQPGSFLIPPTPEGLLQDETGLPVVPVAPGFLPLPVIKEVTYEEPIIEAQHDEYGPPLPPTTPAAEYGPPPTTTEEPTTTTEAPPETTTSAPYPPKPYPERVESHYDGNSGIYKSHIGVFRKVTVHQPKKFF